MSYKWCAVPVCNNTSLKTPEKLFICVPKDAKLRKKWLQLARRKLGDIAVNSVIFFCEDHFNIEKDMANYIKYKMGFSKRIIMVDGVLPSKFYCQQNRKKIMCDASTSQPKFVKRQKCKIESQCEDIKPIVSVQEVVISKIHTTTESLQAWARNTSTEPVVTAEKSVQFNSKPKVNFRSKAVQANTFPIDTSVSSYKNSMASRFSQKMDGVNVLEKEIEELRKLLHTKEEELYQLKKNWNSNERNSSIGEKSHENINIPARVKCDKLPKWAIERYSRQILLPDIGVQGQEKICAAKVLIVGAGGLGCPAGAYLAGAGVGEIGIVDYDTVEITNIHRQILHTEADRDMSKAESAAQTLRSINSKIKIVPYTVQLNSTNAMDIASKYDMIIDCTDNVPTRYLLSDLSVIAKIPLISGSALKMDGQLTIYGYRADKNPNETDSKYIGPCYRCVFANPPPPETVQSCSANGVAGPVPGVIGALQALEAIKYIVGVTRKQLLVERMMIFDGHEMTFRTVKLRTRHPRCATCSDTPTITQLVDYEAFCKAQACEKELDLHILNLENRITAKELASLLQKSSDNMLIDVRSEHEFSMCRIDGASNWPIDKLRPELLDELIRKISECRGSAIFVCRRGNDSQMVAKMTLDMLEGDEKTKVKDLAGGLHAWAQNIDPQFPVY